jgi:hypothetical protein
LCGLKFRKYPYVCGIVCLILIAAGAAGIIVFREWKFGMIVVWFLLVGNAAVYIERDFREANHLRNVTWHWVLLYALSTFIFFSRELYPRIAPSLGGGQPVTAVFQFSSPSPIDGKSTNQLWLLDEVDTGYYVLRDPNEHKAIFVSRGLVTAIYFDADQAASSKTQ